MKIKENSVLPVFAMRYAATRLTAAPITVANEIRDLLHQIPENRLEMLEKELYEIEYVGDETWEKLLQEVKKEREKRKK